MNFAEVYINKKIAPLDHTFIYEIPPELIGRVKVGTVVSAPFGHSTVKAVVTALRNDSGEYNTKYIDNIINEDFIFPQDLLELGSYIADYYLNTTISVFRAMIPAGIDIFGKIQKPKLEIWLKVNKSLEPGLLRGKKQRELYEYVLAEGEVKEKTAREDLGYSSSVLKALLEKSFIIKEKRPIERRSYAKPQQSLPARHKLTLEQNRVVESILSTCGKDKRPILLHGVTGSGKTEVYLNLAEYMYNRGQQTIVLMPEIALTPQFIEIFESRFPGEVVLMHSRLSSGERRDAWYAIREGRAKIVLGARSAVFAPTEQLGLIIMDEEQENSYEQENTPKFHTREVAIKRCKLSNAIFLMGSATPSLESYWQAQKGEYRLFTLSQRIDSRPLPQVITVDMRAELAEGWKEVLSRPLIKSIAANLEEKNQTILFLNRLGSRTFVSCRDCGFVYQCPDCGVSLVYYESKRLLCCNRCGYKISPENTCPQCHGSRIRYFGLGTEGLEKVVRKYFPQARIDRLDSDSTKLKDNFDKIYWRMLSGETDILIGTSMIAKGWDFPGVTLTGIIAADLTLNLPDFRAAEKTFQSITQISGRCGRGNIPGKVILQTYRPEEKVLRYGAEQDYTSFFSWELEKRKIHGYPPFSQTLRVIFTAPKGYLFAADIENLREGFTDSLMTSVEILGPVPAVYRYQKDEERWYLTLMGESLADLRDIYQAACEKLIKDKVLDKNIKVQVEVNPVHIV